MAILVIDDDTGIVEFIQRGLESAGVLVLTATDGPNGFRMALAEDVALVILDLMLPGISGEDLLLHIRAHRPGLPVIVLTGKDRVDDRVRVISAGADDYVTKPFSISELIARVFARLRTPEQAGTMSLTHNDVSLDISARRATVGGESRDLSSREFALLQLLMRHPNAVLSENQILDRVWGYDSQPTSNVVEVYVHQLRKKFGANVIETVRGVGYRMDGRLMAE